MSALRSFGLALAKLRKPSNPLLCATNAGLWLYKLAFEREPQSVQLNCRHIGRVNDAILPNIGGTNLELSVRRLLLASQCEQPEHDLERRRSF